ncbi:hypothetical protein BGZ76_006871 [Entomortierella beljakovae]|nr:hypothetical protein BGZ76_006871 [Entomortierella beljakovae]
MASVLLFPTVATHRRLPHLPKEPKVSKEQETDIHQLSINNHHPIPTVDLSNKPLSLTQSTDQHQLTVPSDTAPSGGLKLIEQHGAIRHPMIVTKVKLQQRHKAQLWRWRLVLWECPLVVNLQLFLTLMQFQIKEGIRSVQWHYKVTNF